MVDLILDCISLHVCRVTRKAILIRRVGVSRGIIPPFIKVTDIPVPNRTTTTDSHAAIHFHLTVIVVSDSLTFSE